MLAFVTPIFGAPAVADVENSVTASATAPANANNFRFMWAPTDSPTGRRQSVGPAPRGQKVLSGRDRRRSGDPTLFRRVLCQLSYPAVFLCRPRYGPGYPARSTLGTPAVGFASLHPRPHATVFKNR